MNRDGPAQPARIGIFRRMAVLRYSEPLVTKTAWLRPRAGRAATAVAALLLLAGWALLAG